MSGYVKTFKIKDGDKNKNNISMSFFIDDEKLLKRYKTIWTKIEEFINIDLNDLPDYDDRFIETIENLNFCGLNRPEDDIKCETFRFNSINSWLVYENKYYMQVYLDNFAYKIVDRRIKLMKINFN